MSFKTILEEIQKLGTSKANCGSSMLVRIKLLGPCNFTESKLHHVCFPGNFPKLLEPRWTVLSDSLNLSLNDTAKSSSSLFFVVVNDGWQKLIKISQVTT